jgi:TolA-binding protein
MTPRTRALTFGWVLGALGVLLVGTPACGGKQVDAAWPQAFSEAERAQTAGRFAEAAERYDAAAKRAPNARERAHAEWLAGKMMASAGDVRGASARFEQIANAAPSGEHAPRALYDLGSLRIDNGNEAGWNDLERVAVTWPKEGIANRALQRVCAHKDQTDKRGTVAWLASIAPKVANTELEESVEYQQAVRLHALGDLDAAHAKFMSIVERFPYPHGRTWDDSLFHASEIDEAKHDYTEAIAHLEAMLKEREVASLMGSYQRPRFTPALLRIATLYRDRLHDNEHARKAFHRLYADFTTSTMRDDALWQEARLWKADGDASEACSRLSTLVSDFPDSRYVPCAIAQCTGVTRPGKSKAPKTCHPYLER